MHSGSSRPPLVPHHSSTIQSLYARHAQLGELLVLAPEEDLAGEARVVGEAELGLHVVDVHVGDAVGNLPAAGADLVERGAGERDLLGLEPRRRDVALQRRHRVLVAPPHDVGTLGARRLLVDGAVEHDLAAAGGTRRAVPTSRNFAGSRGVQMSGGSTRCASRSTIRGIFAISSGETSGSASCTTVVNLRESAPGARAPATPFSHPRYAAGATVGSGATRPVIVQPCRCLRFLMPDWSRGGTALVRPSSHRAASTSAPTAWRWCSPPPTAPSV